MRAISISRIVVVCLCTLLAGIGLALALIEISPLQLLRDQEWKNKDRKGEIYLGKVMTLSYTGSSVEPDVRDHPLLLELTDILKTPLRENYRLELRGDPKRAERLKESLVQDYRFEESRIAVQGLGNEGASEFRSTPQHQAQSSVVEIHVYGDISEAVRYTDRQEEK